MQYRARLFSNLEARLIRASFIMPLVFACLLASPRPGAAWEGQVIVKDGIPHLMNPARPVEPPITVQPDRLWRISGEEEDEFFFGVLTQIAGDEQGNIYLLDVQLNQVLVFSAGGEFIRAIGRQGEGPGEFNRPSDLFVTAGGDIAVLQTQPGKIILLSPEGEPRGNYPMPEPQDGGMQMFSSGQRAGDRVVVFVGQFTRRDDGFAVVSSLIGVDGSGKLVATYFTDQDDRSLAGLSFDEKKMQQFAMAWSAGGDGRVYLSKDFDAYQIEVCGPDGSPERVIEREYEHRVRSEKEIERATPRMIIRSGGRTQSPEVTMSKTDRDIVGLFPRQDGTLWVLSSRGAYDAPAGAIATFDVYDGGGRFARQVTLVGDGSFREDGIQFIGDRLYVLRGMRSARRAAFGGGESDEEAPDEPMSVLCYDLKQVVQSRR